MVLVEFGAYAGKTGGRFYFPIAHRFFKESSMGSHFGVIGGRGIGLREVLEGSGAGQEVFGNGRKKFQ